MVESKQDMQKDFAVASGYRSIMPSSAAAPMLSVRF
jgi:hypothetical protein